MAKTDKRLAQRLSNVQNHITIFTELDCIESVTKYVELPLFMQGVTQKALVDRYVNENCLLEDDRNRLMREKDEAEDKAVSLRSFLA
jgi:hypothetical protein